MKYKDVTVISRMDGKPEPAKLFQCDSCGSVEFLIYQVANHPHLQCLKCGTTFCQGHGCDGVEKLKLSGN